MIHDVLKQGGTWTMLAPIANLTLTDQVDREVRVNRVTFVSTQRLPYVHKRLGIKKRISELRRDGDLKRILGPAVPCLAVLRLTGVLKEKELAFDTLVKEELAILNSSFLGFRRDRFVAKPSFSDQGRRFIRSRVYLSGDGKSGWRHSEVLDGMGKALEQHWLRSARENFFFPLLRILRGEVRVGRGWKKDLRNAAVLLGQSQAASDLPIAFLLNMITLELLLTRQREARVNDALPERAEAFLGWTGYWDSENFETRIRDLYLKRCSLVHQGAREEIEPDDLLFSDELLMNVLSNLVRHPETFGSKDAVISFSERVKAEHLLGIDTGARPRTLRAQFQVTSRERELERAF